TVLIYPGSYLAVDEDALGEEPHWNARLGQASPRGPVVLSWWHARWDGMRLGTTNLVLHEFAHNLVGDLNDGMPLIDDPDLEDRWEQVTDAEYKRLVGDATRQRRTLLRHYGATNKAEFFAVASECFFLQPVELRRRHPELYKVLAEWYRQDPAARPTNDTIASQVNEADVEYH